MTARRGGKLYLRNTESREIVITKYFKSREESVIYAKRLHTKLNHEEIWLLTTHTKQDKYEGYFVLTVTIGYWDGISEMMLQKLDELLNT